MNKTKIVNCKSERIVLVGNSAKLSESTCLNQNTLETPIRRQTYLVGEKENLPNLKKNMFCLDFTDSNYSFKRPHKNRQNQVFNNHFNFQNENKNCNIMSDDSLDEPLKIVDIDNSPFNNFCLTPLKSTENLLSPFSISKQCKSFDKTDEHLELTSLNTSLFQPIDASTGAKTYTPEAKKSTRVSVNLCNKFDKTFKRESSTTFTKNIINSKTFKSPEVEKSFDFSQNKIWRITPKMNNTSKKNKILNALHFKIYIYLIL